MRMTKAVCAACRHKIDATAKLCPYCGANPATGEKMDTQALLQEVFQSRQLSTSESVLEYARQRQGIVIAIGVIVSFLVLAGIHSFVTMRNATLLASEPAVPLSEITELSPQADAVKPQPLPADLTFQYDGRPQTMRTFITEPGAVTPPEVIAAQQAAQLAAQQKAQEAAAAAHPGQPATVVPPGARAGIPSAAAVPRPLPPQPHP
jgi:hypothetical protein